MPNNILFILVLIAVVIAVVYFIKPELFKIGMSSFPDLKTKTSHIRNFVSQMVSTYGLDNSYMKLYETKEANLISSALRYENPTQWMDDNMWPLLGNNLIDIFKPLAISNNSAYEAIAAEFNTFHAANMPKPKIESFKTAESMKEKMVNPAMKNTLFLRNQTAKNDKFVNILASDVPRLAGKETFRGRENTTSRPGAGATPGSHNTSNPFKVPVSTIISSHQRAYDVDAVGKGIKRTDTTRPLPRGAVDMALKNLVGQDPNSLQASPDMTAYAILEAGRGNAGNQYISTALDYLRRNTDKKLVHKYNDRVREANSIGNRLVSQDDSKKRSIIADLKGGQKPTDTLA